MSGTDYKKSLDYVLGLMGNGCQFIDIPYNHISDAANYVSILIREIVYDYGLPDLSQAKLPPISDSVVMRALVMLRCVWRYECENLLFEDKFVEFELREGETVQILAPKQEELCSEKAGRAGLIRDAYEEMSLGTIGYPPETACSGAPHIQAAAHLLSHAGLLLPRGANRVGEDGNRLKAKSRIPYGLTDQGRLFSYWLFGDKPFITTGSLRGYTGIPAVISNRDGSRYSGWLNAMKISEGR